jgi:ubiquinone/menaquinone biosynthesis C-methylase UbiE
MTVVDQEILISEERYRPVLANQATGRTLHAVYREAYGDEYSSDVEPFGFVTLSELAFIAEEQAAVSASRILDVGCGRGGPGLWVASELGAELCGVDIVAEAVDAAAERAAAHFPAVPARFHAASATDLPLPDASFDAAMSIDALWMVFDKLAALREVARVLRPGSRFIFTSWEPAHLSYRQLLEAAGFTDVVGYEIDGWRERQTAVYEGILRHRDAIAAEMGADAAAVLVAEAEEAPTMLTYAPRVVISAFRG